MGQPNDLPPEQENKHHTYTTNRIPWFIHLIWIGFWIMAITYVLYYQFPAIRHEILSPP